MQGGWKNEINRGRNKRGGLEVLTNCVTTSKNTKCPDKDNWKQILFGILTHVSFTIGVTQKSTNLLQFSRKIKHLISGGPNKSGGCRVFRKKVSGDRTLIRDLRVDLFVGIPHNHQR